jgi:hypothetical protein
MHRNRNLESRKFISVAITALFAANVDLLVGKRSMFFVGGGARADYKPRKDRPERELGKAMNTWNR